MARYEFVPVTASDLPMLRGWLTEPHVAKWWDDPDEWIPRAAKRVAAGEKEMRIVRLDGAPFAYVQDYPIRKWPTPQFEGCTEDARGMDAFLGEPSMLGKGHGAAYLRQRAQELLSKGHEVLVDPACKNDRAVAAYRSAGFVGDKETLDAEGEQVVVMTFTNARASGLTDQERIKL